MIKTNKYEKELEKSFDNSEWISVKDLEKQKENYAQVARNTFQKNKRINIRISEWDLIRLKAKSLKQGIPYQTLVSSLIHKYVTETLVERNGVKL